MHIRLKHGFVFLVAAMNLFSRYFVSWEISTSIEPKFCGAALKAALGKGRPKYFKTDQDARFTSKELTSILNEEKSSIGIDGRVIDNIINERFRGMLKYSRYIFYVMSPLRKASGVLGNTSSGTTERDCINP